MINPKLLYIRCAITPEPAYIYQGVLHVVTVDTHVLASVNITAPNAPMGNSFPIGDLIAIYEVNGPPRLITHEEHATLLRDYLSLERVTDTWFVQQKDINLLYAYNAGFDARSKYVRDNQMRFNPHPPGDDMDVNILHYAWQRGWARHEQIYAWREERYK